MDERKPTRPRNQGSTPPQAGRTPSGGGAKNEWLLDPVDVRRHARLMRERERIGPLGKLVRYTAVVLVLVGAGLIYWNFETLRGLRVDFPGLTELFARHPNQGDGAPAAGGETPQTEVIAATEVAGATAETSLSSERPAAADAPAPPAQASPSAEAAAPAAAPQDSPPAAPVKPAPPPGPERFSFGLDTIHVSEGNASADLLILRSGDMRRASAVTWWTSDGTATAGQDYANLGRVVVKFAPNEQNRGIHVPIIGDRTVEGPENFYVNLAPGDAADGAPTDRVEVVIDDDD